MGIYNSLRSYNYFPIPKNINSSSNVGGFGIDGGVSTLIGASLANPNRLYIGVFGDLAFFYDMNVLGNRHVGNNVRILLINNGKGNEFRNYGHLCSIFGDDADPYIAAARHFGNKSHNLVRHLAEDLGFEYLSACTKEEFLAKYQQLLNPIIGEKPLIFEIFTNTQDESDSIKKIRCLVNETKTTLKNIILKSIRGSIGIQGINAIKRVLGKY